jgi:hypothetical protein
MRLRFTAEPIGVDAGRGRVPEIHRPRPEERSSVHAAAPSSSYSTDRALRQTRACCVRALSPAPGPACRAIASARRINLGGNNGTPALRALVRQGFKNFGVATYTRPDGGDGSGGDGSSTAPPRIGVIDHTFYHSTADTVDFVPAIGIQQATQAYAYILDQINKMDMNQVRLPKKSQQQITQRGR